MFLQLRANVAYANGAENVVHHVFDTLGGTIGRDPHCQMVLQDPFRRISRIQAQIVFDGAQFTLINASTSNPIYIDGNELSPGATCAVQIGSTWQTGNYAIIVEHIGAPPQVDAAVEHEPSANAMQQPQSHLVHEPVPVEIPVAATGVRGPFDDLLSTPVAPPQELAGQPISPTGLPSEGLPVPISGPDNHGLPSQPLLEQQLPAHAEPPPDPFASAEEPTPEARHWVPEIRVQGADPFADLLATPLSHQVAAAPPYLQKGATARAPSLIPEDFNPLALEGVSPRNTADPLSQMQTRQSFQDMFPERSVDAIFQPSEGNIGELTQDPLNAGQHQSLIDSSTKLDPLELFANQSSETRLDPATLFKEHTGQGRATADHRVEVGAYFRAPRAYDPSAPQPLVEADPVPDMPGVPAPYAPIACDDAGARLPAGLTDGNSLESLFNIASSPSELDAFDLGAGAPRGQASEHDAPVAETIQSYVAPEVVTPVLLPEQVQQPASSCTPEPADAAEPAALTPETVMAPATALTPNLTPEPSHPSAVVPGLDAAVPATISRTETLQHRSQSYSAQELLHSFKAGAGLTDCRYPENLTPELMHIIGSMLGASIQGCMDLLGSRAAAKQEVRVSVTLINAEANNPLKFLPTGASALAQIFGPRMPGFQAGPAAVASAFQDLRGHEMAMMAGTQAAVSGLFERFSPKHLEEQLQAQGRAKTLFASQRQARLWEMYCSHYEWLKDEMKNQSPTAWGTEFLSAYQAEVSNNNEGQTN